MDNPKAVHGLKKIPYSYLPKRVLALLALGMYEGRKYGRHNYRVVGKITSSVYTDAAQRHLHAYEEGRDIDPASGLHEILKAITSLIVLLDAIYTGRVDDDRPPKLEDGWLEKLNEEVERINQLCHNPAEAYTEKNFRSRLGEEDKRIAEGKAV